MQKLVRAVVLLTLVVVWVTTALSEEQAPQVGGVFTGINNEAYATMHYAIEHARYLEGPKQFIYLGFRGRHGEAPAGIQQLAALPSIEKIVIDPRNPVPGIRHAIHVGRDALQGGLTPIYAIDQNKIIPKQGGNTFAKNAVPGDAFTEIVQGIAGGLPHGRAVQIHGAGHSDGTYPLLEAAITAKTRYGLPFTVVMAESLRDEELYLRAARTSSETHFFNVARAQGDFLTLQGQQRLTLQSGQMGRDVLNPSRLAADLAQAKAAYGATLDRFKHLALPNHTLLLIEDPVPSGSLIQRFLKSHGDPAQITQTFNTSIWQQGKLLSSTTAPLGEITKGLIQTPQFALAPGAIAREWHKHLDLGPLPIPRLNSEAIGVRQTNPWSDFRRMMDIPSFDPLRRR